MRFLLVAPRAQILKRVLWTVKRKICGAAVKNRKAYAEGIFGHRKWGASGSNPSFGHKKIRNAFAFRIHIWLPHEDSNPDKQSQSLPCYRYTIGQYLTCFTIIFIFEHFVNSILKKFQFFLSLSTKFSLCIIIKPWQTINLKTEVLKICLQYIFPKKNLILHFPKGR